MITVAEVNGRQMVCARNLHAALKSKQKYSRWIKDRIEKYGFEERTDYQIKGIYYAPVTGGFYTRKTFGRVNNEYLLTLSTAKEIAVTEDNNAGIDIRRFLARAEEALSTGMSFEEYIAGIIVDAA